MRRVSGVAFMSALILAAVTACGSGGNSNGGGAGGTSSAVPSVAPAARIPATPADVPTGNVTCNTATPDPVNTPSDLNGLIGLCANQAGTELEVINFSEEVLDIYPAAGDSMSLPTYGVVPSDPLPTLAGFLEVDSQNAVVQDSTGSAGASLLPIGGTITALTATPPATVYVSVDRTVTRKTFFDAAYTSYVMGIIQNAKPEDWYQSIAECVNSSVNFSQELQSKPPPDVGQLLYDGIQAITACKKLQDKINEYLESENKPKDDVFQETLDAGDHSDESDWATHYEQDEVIQHESVDDIR
jgi:hypothetical protein